MRRSWLPIALAAVLLWALVAAIAFSSSGHDGSCSAPCTVHFAQPMQEDEFSIDYRPGGTLRVERIRP
jgi:hypothetical protein